MDLTHHLERRVAAFVASQDVLVRGERALLMLSGGADSMALLAAMPGVSGRLGLDLTLAAVHVDYATRGTDSVRDREIVRRACEAAGVPLHVVRLGSRLSGAAFQARARELRYRRAREVAASRGCDVVVTAHNRDDQAETVLYRLVKYATPRGLAGMRPREGALARPLLCLRAAEIREYCRARGIEYGEDVTNARPQYARNFLRLEVVPLLQRVNPRVVDTLADTAGMAAAEADVLATATGAAVQRVGRAPQAGEIAALDVAALAAEPPALRALVLHAEARRALGGEALVGRRRVEALLSLCAARDDAGRAALGRGVEAVRCGGRLAFRAMAAAHSCPPAFLTGPELAAAGPGGVSLAFCGRVFRLALVDGPAFDRAAALAGDAYAGLSARPTEVRLRHPRRGERFAPLGLDAGTTLARHLAAARVPAAARPFTVVLDVDDATAWAGYAARSGRPTGRVARGFAVHESSRWTLNVSREDS